MYDLNKRAYISTLGELRELLAELPDDTEILACGSSDAWLHFEKDNSLEDQIKKVRNQGFELLPPDVNKSNVDLTPVDENKILFGFRDIKGIGESAINKIIEKRPYSDFTDFILRSGVSSLVVKKLIMSGAFDCFDIFDNFIKS